MARHYGYRVTSITLHFLGGMTAIDSEAKARARSSGSPSSARSPPSRSGGAPLGLWFVTPDGLLLMAVEGLACGQPARRRAQPGPRAARWTAAGCSRRRSGADRATRTAAPSSPAWGGRVTAVAVLLWPFAQGAVLDIEPDLFDYPARVRHRLVPVDRRQPSPCNARRSGAGSPSLVARNLARRTLAVPEDLPLAEAVRRAQDAQAGGIVTVTSSGRPVGVVNEAALLATPEDRRPWVATSTVARSVDDGLSLPVSIAGEDLVQAITRTPATEYLLVEDDGSIYGVLTTADVDRAFRAVPD